MTAARAEATRAAGRPGEYRSARHPGARKDRACRIARPRRAGHFDRVENDTGRRFFVSCQTPVTHDLPTSRVSSGRPRRHCDAVVQAATEPSPVRLILKWAGGAAALPMRRYHPAGFSTGMSSRSRQRRRLRLPQSVDSCGCNSRHQRDGSCYRMVRDDGGGDRRARHPKRGTAGWRAVLLRVREQFTAWRRSRSADSPGRTPSFAAMLIYLNRIVYNGSSRRIRAEASTSRSVDMQG